MRSKGHRNTTIRASYSASHKRSHEKITLAATIFFGNGYACVPLFRETFPDPRREIVGAFDFGIIGSYLVSRKVKCAFIGKLVLHWKFEVHKSFAVVTYPLER